MASSFAWLPIVLVAAIGVVLVVRSLRGTPRPTQRPVGGADHPAATGPRAAKPSVAKVAMKTLDEGEDIEDTVMGRRPAELKASNHLEGDITSATDDAENPTRPFPLIFVSASGRSDPGRRRDRNEDALLMLEDAGLYIVADGMGGHAAGEIASKLAIDIIGDAFRTGKFEGEREADLPVRADELVRAISMANARVLQQSREHADLTGMGTTIVAARFTANKQRVYFAHVGDSRAYRLRAGKLRQLTTDHTLGALGIQGPASGKLVRAVGTEERVEVDVFTDAPEGGDRYLLCSDGLSRMVPDATIRDIVTKAADVDGAVTDLIDEANKRGGKDNITVIVLRVDEPGDIAQVAANNSSSDASA